QQPPLAVATYLSLSERQFYRESNRALESLAVLLWEMVKGELPETTTFEKPSTDEAVAVQSEVQLVQSANAHHTTDILALLDGVASAVADFAAQNRIRLGVSMEESGERQALSVRADRTLVRQALMMILNDLIDHLSPGSDAKLSLITSMAARQA